jgi:hypothetical protein
MFLIDEDKALREKLQGMTVSDQKSASDNQNRNVGVWFGQPDQEIRNQSYPYITIDMVSVDRDTEREMRGLNSPWYLDPGNLGENEAYLAELPIPVMITYQVTTYARHPRHDREIIAQLLSQKFPLRFGYLSVPTGKVDGSGIPENTLRRLDILGVSKRDVTEQAKRLFVNAITVRVSSEVVQSVVRILNTVTEVHGLDVLDIHAGGTPHNPYFVGPGSYTTTA